MNYLKINSLLAKYGVLLMIPCLLLLTGCNKDEEDEITTSNIIGKWTISAVTFDIKIGEVSLIDYLIDQLGLTEEEADLYRSLIDSELDSEFEGTIEFKSNQTFNIDIGGESDTGTWELSSDNKTLILDEGTEDETIAEVKILTSTQLHLVFTTNEYLDFDEDGTEDVMSVVVDMQLVK
jgi:hypothetical protein